MDALMPGGSPHGFAVAYEEQGFGEVHLCGSVRGDDAADNTVGFGRFGKDDAEGLYGITCPDDGGIVVGKVGDLGGHAVGILDRA